MFLNNKAIAFCLAVSFATMQPLAALAEQYTAMEGTPLRLKLMDTVSSSKNKEGDTINFQVTEDVLAEDGKTVLIKAGTAAWGTVSEVKQRAMLGEKGELGITLEATKAVDGKRVPIRASISREGQSKVGTTIALSLLITPLFLFMRGKDAKLPAGSLVSGYVDRDVVVNASPAAPVLSTAATVETKEPSAVPEYLQKYMETEQSSDALKALEQLKSQGLLTQEEYEAKKKALFSAK